ncbi:MAG: hypothetical protein PHC51_07570 [bacterium]|nr:hypothetical protein [bacterium]
MKRVKYQPNKGTWKIGRRSYSSHIQALSALVDLLETSSPKQVEGFLASVKKLTFYLESQHGLSGEKLRAEMERNWLLGHPDESQLPDNVSRDIESLVSQASGPAEKHQIACSPKDRLWEYQQSSYGAVCYKSALDFVSKKIPGGINDLAKAVLYQLFPQPERLTF